MGLFVKTAIRNPRWFGECIRAAGRLVTGRHNFESFENALKIAAMRHGVDYHEFGE